MTMRPKTKRRLLILGVSAVVVIGAVGGFVDYRLNVANELIQQFKTEGMDAYNKGDYATAIDKLGAYYKKRHDDTDALLALGISYDKVPSIDNSNKVMAVEFIEKYALMRPNDLDAQHRLLDMETPLRSATFDASAIATAQEVLRDHPEDATALKSLALVQEREQRFDQALDAATKYTAMHPTDLEIQQLVLRLMQQTGKSPRDIHLYADKLAAKYPSDPRFKVLKAWSYYYGRTPGETQEQLLADARDAEALLRDASRQDPPDVQFVNMTMQFLDVRGMYAESQDLLNRAYNKLHDPQLYRALVQRLWQTGRFAQVVDHLKDVNAGSASADPQLLAYKAMSLNALGKKDQADAIVKALTAAGDSEPTAYAWAVTLHARFYGANDPRKQIDQYEGALAKDPVNAVTEQFLGDTYAGIGEADLAMAAWHTASQLAPSWGEPQLRIGQTLIAQGKSEQAQPYIRKAMSADAIGDQSNHLVTQADAVITQAMADFEDLQRTNNPDRAKALLKTVQEIQAQIPGEPSTLPMYVALLAQTGDRDGAIKVIQDQIALKTTNPMHQSVLLKLAQVSQIDKLGMSPELFAAIDKQYGMTPDLAFNEAVQLLADGRGAEGLKLISGAAAKDSGNPQGWARALCTYREVSHDPNAATAWRALGDKYPNDLAVQSTIVEAADSVWSDRSFMDRTINRLKNLTGDDALAWKIARARWLVSGPHPTADDANKAITLLNEVNKDSSQDAQAHIWLASAYELLKNQQATTEWRIADRLKPNDPVILYNLLKSLVESQNLEEARATFDRLAGLPHLSPGIALDAARLIAEAGDADRAESILLAYPDPADPVAHDALLAKAYALKGHVNEAANIYFRLESAPRLDVDTAIAGASFFGAEHDLAASRAFLDKLPGDLKPGMADLIRADFEEHYGDSSAAKSLYVRAVTEAGDNPAPSIAEIGYLIRHQDWNGARADTATALGKWPDNTALANLKMAEDVIATDPTLVKQHPMLFSELSRDPGNAAAAGALKTLADAGAAGPSATLQHLLDLNGKYPDFLPLYQMTVVHLLEAGRGEDAANLANRAMGQFPKSPDAAEIAAETLKVLHRWNEATVAAREWRQRSADPQEADLMLASIDLYTDDPNDAIDRLSPYIAAAKAAPDQHEGVLVAYGEAMIRAGRENEAIALLQPLAERSAAWRDIWLKMTNISHTDGPSAVAWVDRIKPLLDPKSISDQQTLAVTYMAIASYQHYPQAYELARKTLQPFIASPEATHDLMLTYALAASSSNDVADAEKAYRLMIQREPSAADAKNNLADLLRSSGSASQLPEAEQLARQAIASNSKAPSSSTYYDTLARILLREGKVTDAQSTWQAGLKLQPNDLNILVGLAWTDAQHNQLDAASRYLEQVESLPGGQSLTGELASEAREARQLINRSNSRLSGADIMPAAK